MALTQLDPATLASGGVLAAILALGAVFMVVALAVYIYSAIALMFIAKKTGTPNGWLAFIPIANVYLVTQMAGISGWWTLIVLAPMIPFIGGLAMMAAMIWMFWKVAEEIKFPGWTSLLLILPLVNLVILGIWAWAKK